MTSDFAIPYGYNADGTFPSYTEPRHLLTFGPTRSGKGATVIVQALLRVPHSLICIDPKGQNTAITIRQRRTLGDVFCLNPFGLHPGEPWKLPRHRFNPLAHLEIESENVVADVGGLAEALIINDGKDAHWTNSARDLVSALILHLVAGDRKSATLPRMRYLLTLPDAGFRDTISAMAKSERGFIAQPAARFLQDTNEIRSIISTASTQTKFLDDPALAHPDTGTLTGSDFSMLDLKRKATTVFLILPGRYMEAYARLFRLVITSAIDQLTAEPGGHPTLMLLDEFATLQNLAAISKAFGFAAGFNLQCWAFLQDIPQLKAIYSDKWESFVANAGLLQFFTPADMTTAEYLERRGGQLTSESVGKQVSPWLKIPRQLSFNEKRMSLLPPEYTMSMEGHEQIVFFGGKHSPHTAQRRFYRAIPRLHGLWDSDPYHT